MGKMVKLLAATIQMLKDFRTYRALAAEFLGSLLLIFMAGGADINSTSQNQGGNCSSNPTIQGSLTVGFTLASLVQTLGHISGGHFNPSVTSAFMITNQMNPFLGLAYFLVQFSGALAGAGLLKLAMKYDGNKSILHHEISANSGPGQTILIEAVATFVLVITIFGVCDKFRSDVKGSPALAIGFAAAASCLVGVQSMNPAISFGFAVVDTTFKEYWVYLIGPFLGGSLAAWTYNLVFQAPDPDAIQKHSGSKELVALEKITNPNSAQVLQVKPNPSEFSVQKSEQNVDNAISTTFSTNLPPLPF